MRATRWPSDGGDARPYDDHRLRWEDTDVFTALLDTCVLWPSKQRDFLLSLAVEGMYRPTWSSVVLEELEYHEAVKLNARQGLTEADAGRRAATLVERMRASFSDAEITGFEGLEGTYGLPDPDDEHVVAAAVAAGAGAIVTSNIKDFPQDRLPAHLQVVSPAEFAENTVAVDPIRARAAIQAIVTRSGRSGPTLSEDDLLDILTLRYSMHGAVELIRQAR